MASKLRTRPPGQSKTRTGSDRVWIASVPCKGRNTILIKAASRKEAEEKLRNPDAYPEDDVECIDHTIHYIGRGQVVREDKPRQNP